jgi:hypothetical protein
MRWALLRTLGGLCMSFLVGCGDGAASPSDGSTAPDSGTAGTGVATGGVQGTGGAAGTGVATGGVQGTGGAAGTGVATGGVQGTGGAAGTGVATGGVQGTGGAVGGSVGTGGGSGGGGAAPLSFAADIWPVFKQVRNPAFVYRGMGSYSGCTAASPCHGSANFGARLSMIDSNTAYAALVNVASLTSLCVGRGALTRVVPGDPDASCLVQFYVGRLKDDLQWVDQTEIDLVRRWIADGARP